MDAKELIDSKIRQILGIVGYQDNHGHWWGMDTECGSDAAIMAQAREIVGMTFSSGAVDCSTGLRRAELTAEQMCGPVVIVTPDQFQ